MQLDQQTWDEINEKINSFKTAVKEKRWCKKDQEFDGIEVHVFPDNLSPHIVIKSSFKDEPSIKGDNIITFIATEENIVEVIERELSKILRNLKSC